MICSSEIRVDEHKAAVKNVKTVDSTIAKHVLGHKHHVDLQSVSVPASECNHLESWFIRKSSTSSCEGLTTSLCFCPNGLSPPCSLLTSSASHVHFLSYCSLFPYFPTLPISWLHWHLRYIPFSILHKEPSPPDFHTQHFRGLLIGSHSI